jgi:hypothetical protein
VIDGLGLNLLNRSLKNEFSLAVQAVNQLTINNDQLTKKHSTLIIDN